EVRVCDGVPTLEEILAITAFIQCLVDDMSARLDAGETLPTMPDWFHNENKWRAARYGMDAIIIENAAADERLVTECLTDEIERLSPVAERLGCVDELHSITSIIERGVPYQRLQRVFQSTGSLTELTRSLIGDLRNSYSGGLVGPGAGPGRPWVPRQRWSAETTVRTPLSRRSTVVSTVVRVRRAPRSMTTWDSRLCASHLNADRRRVRSLLAHLATIHS